MTKKQVRMMNTIIEKYLLQMPDENQCPCTMYALIFHSDESLILLRIIIKAIPKERQKGSMAVNTKQCQN